MPVQIIRAYDNHIKWTGQDVTVAKVIMFVLRNNTQEGPWDKYDPRGQGPMSLVWGDIIYYDCITLTMSNDAV
jgi:hypothetical protein